MKLYRYIDFTIQKVVNDRLRLLLKICQKFKVMATA